MNRNFEVRTVIHVRLTSIMERKTLSLITQQNMVPSKVTAYIIPKIESIT